MDFLSLLNEGVLRSTQDYYVYGYYEPDAHEPFYVGKGRGERMFVHLKASRLQTRTYFYNKLREMLTHGVKPIIETIQGMLTETEALNYEQCLISIYGRRDIGTGCLCNHTDGGDGVSGHIHSDETREKMRKAWITREEMSFDTRIKISVGNSKPKKYTDARRKSNLQKRGRAVESYNLKTGEAIKRYEAICLVKDDGFTKQLVSHCARGVRKHHRGLGWRFV